MTTTSYRYVSKLVIVVSLLLTSGIGRADTIVKGSDYFHTSGAGLNGIGSLESRPGGVDNIRPQYAPLGAISTLFPDYKVDTIIERQGDCNVSLNGSCTIPIELVGLSLQSADGNFWVREDPDKPSIGTMTISYLKNKDGVASGEFDSNFEVNFEYSQNQGATWSDMQGLGIAPYTLGSDNSTWSSDPNGANLFSGLVGDQNANWHTDKNSTQFDFFSGEIREALPTNGNTFHGVVDGSFVPVPPSVFLFSTGLLGLFGMRKKLTS